MALDSRLKTHDSSIYVTMAGVLMTHNKKLMAAASNLSCFMAMSNYAQADILKSQLCSLFLYFVYIHIYSKFSSELILQNVCMGVVGHAHARRMTATHCNTLQHTAICYHALQLTATHCNMSMDMAISNYTQTDIDMGENDTKLIQGGQDP